MKKIFYRSCSFFMAFLILFSSIGLNVMTVYADNTASNFIDFYQNKDSAELQAKNLSNTDYYTMHVYMSNYFKPGVTTLKELIDGSGKFVDDFTKSLGMNDSGKGQVSGVIKDFGNDILKGIQSGKCTLVYGDGKPISGDTLLQKMWMTVDYNFLDDEEYMGEELFLSSADSKVYYESGEHLAFDLSEKTVRGSFQVLFAYSPDMFLMTEGLHSLKFLFVDATGNIWGCRSEAVNDSILDGVNPDYDRENFLKEDKLDYVYLVLPACLNPATFTPNATAQNQLRMPLMNRFVLSAILNSSDVKKNDGTFAFADNFVPFYNAFANTNSTAKKNILNVVGVHSFSDYIMNLNGVHNASKTWEDAANFIYNPKSFTVALSGEDGIAEIGTNTYIMFGINLAYLKTLNGEGGGTGKIDMHEGMWWWDETAFSVWTTGQNGEEYLKDRQKLLITYLATPNLFSLNEVSMNFYKYEPSTGSEESFSTQFRDFITSDDYSGLEVIENDEVLDIKESTFSSSQLTKLGITGMSLFLEDISVEIRSNDNNYLLVTPDNMIHSRLVQEFVNHDSLGVGLHDSDVYKKISSASSYSESELFNLIMFYNYNDKSYNAVSNACLNDGFSFGPSDMSFKNYDDDDTPYAYYINPNKDTMINIGNKERDILVARSLSYKDCDIYPLLRQQDEDLSDDDWLKKLCIVSDDGAGLFAIYSKAYYAYSLFFPTASFDGLMNGSTTSGSGNTSLSVFGRTKTTDVDNEQNLPNNSSKIYMKNFSDNIMMGLYLGYMVDMMGLGTCIEGQSLTFGTFRSPFLPKYDITSNGDNLSIDSRDNSLSGVGKSEDLSFEEKQKDLINRIYGMTNDTNNDYRNSWIKSVLEGFILTIHRTITGTWASSISSVSSGQGSTYNSVTGYIYTPTLEELSFTATLMNNYIQIYIICMILVMFLLVLMVLLHLRTWQQGVLTCCIMFVAFLFPYILISNTISVSNKISNGVFSERFDFWAMTEHLQSVTSLKGADYMDEKDKWLTIGNATTDTTKYGASGIKIKWMAPKKVDTFQELYSDASLSDSFVTNMQIFKWLFASTIYDSEYVDTDVYGSFVYRGYNNIALEAASYYKWGEALEDVNNSPLTNVSTTYNSKSYTLPRGINTLFNDTDGTLKSKAKLFHAGFGRIDRNFFTNESGVGYGSSYKMSREKYDDTLLIAQYQGFSSADIDAEADKIGMWGMFANDLNSELVRPDAARNTVTPGIGSNLPMESYSDNNFTATTDPSLISKSIYLKNTESPYYYFYSVLKKRYSQTSTANTSFKSALLDGGTFKVSNGVALTASERQVNNTFRDFLDMEGLFTYIVPYLQLGNIYVEEWQEINGSEIEQYNFQYEVDEKGEVIEESVGKDSEDSILEQYKAADGSIKSTYTDAVKKKNAMNRVWNLYSPWVDCLYSQDVTNVKVTVAGKTKYIDDTLNPSTYINAGRPMIFSEADMIVKGYSFKDLTDVERKIQAVTEKTYKDLMYLVNYYDMDDEVLLCAAAMYATFNFNEEFSKDSFLGESIMLYPQGFELKNFNYDAFMRLALLNSTGETVFAEDDLYQRVLSKTSVFTGLLLLICDLIACIVIPLFKFIIILSLLFLGLLICVACVVNPPEKIFESVNKSLLIPTVAFMALNIVFSYAVSIVVGEGLTSYVGSKTVNLATNDPSITMLVMALCGIAYIFFAWKILKMIINAYKKFGMSSVLATVGIIGGAFSAATTGLAKKGLRAAGKVGGGTLGAAVGAVTAGKGNRLAGAFEGATSGTRGVINQRIRDKRRRQDLMDAQLAGSNPALTDKINSLSETTGTGESVDTSTPTTATPTTETPITETPTTETAATETPTTDTSTTADVKEKKPKSDMTRLGRTLVAFENGRAKLADGLEAVKTGWKKTQIYMNNDGAKDGAYTNRDYTKRLVREKIGDAFSKAGNAVDSKITNAEEKTKSYLRDKAGSIGHYFCSSFDSYSKAKEANKISAMDKSIERRGQLEHIEKSIEYDKMFRDNTIEYEKGLKKAKEDAKEGLNAQQSINAVKYGGGISGNFRAGVQRYLGV